jgi:putative FmdB family regulatory protein
VPIYEYACKNCEHTLDALQKISDDPLLKCPACGKPQLKRLISAPRFRLKGSGWYETDFKKDKQRNLSKGEGDAATSAKSETPDSTPVGDKSGSDKAVVEKSTAKSAEKSGDSKTGPSKTAESKSE